MTWDRARIETLRRLHNRGLKVPAIARQMGASQRDVYRKLKVMNGELSFAWSPEEIAQVIQHLAAGLTTGEIARRVGRTPQATRKKVAQIKKGKLASCERVVGPEVVRTDDGAYVRACLAQGGFVSREVVNGRVVETWPDGRVAQLWAVAA